MPTETRKQKLRPLKHDSSWSSSSQVQISPAKYLQNLNKLRSALRNVPEPPASEDDDDELDLDRVERLRNAILEAYDDAGGEPADGRWSLMANKTRLSCTASRKWVMPYRRDVPPPAGSWILAETEEEWFAWEKQRASELKRFEDEKRLKRRVAQWQHGVQSGAPDETPVRVKPGPECVQQQQKAAANPKPKPKAHDPQDPSPLGFSIVKRNSSNAIATGGKPPPSNGGTAASKVRSSEGKVPPTSSDADRHITSAKKSSSAQEDAEFFRASPIVKKNSSNLEIESSPRQTQGAAARTGPTARRKSVDPLLSSSPSTKIKDIADIPDRDSMPPLSFPSHLQTSTPQGLTKPPPLSSSPPSSPMAAAQKRRRTPTPDAPSKRPAHAVATPEKTAKLPTLTDILASVGKKTPKSKFKMSASKTAAASSSTPRSETQTIPPAPAPALAFSSFEEDVDEIEMDGLPPAEVSPAKSMTSIADSSSSSSESNRLPDFTADENEFDPPLTSTQKPQTSSFNSRPGLMSGKGQDTQLSSVGGLGFFNSQLDTGVELDDVTKFLDRDVDLTSSGSVDYEGWLNLRDAAED